MIILYTNLTAELETNVGSLNFRLTPISAFKESLVVIVWLTISILLCVIKENWNVSFRINSTINSEPLYD